MSSTAKDVQKFRVQSHHKCQSKLWRCAARGWHPAFVVYAQGSAWLVHRPLQAWAHRIPRADFTHEEILDAARAGRVGLLNEPAYEEVPC